MRPSPISDLPPRPWEVGERPSDDGARDLGVEGPWRAKSSPPGVTTTSEFRIPSAETFLLYELLRRSARALIALSDRLDVDEPNVRTRARIAATANLFLVLGALSSRGIFLPRVPGADDVPNASMLFGSADACRALAEEIEQFLDTIGDGRPATPEEMARLVDRIEECWEHVGGSRRERGAP